MHVKGPRREGGAKQPRLLPRKAQITQAHATEGGARAPARLGQLLGCIDLGLDGARQCGQRGGAHGLQQGLAALEMPICGIGHHAGAARGLAQHQRWRPALAHQGNAGVQQRAAQVAMAVGWAPRGLARGCGMGHRSERNGM